MKQHYCLQCGTQMESKLLEGRAREVCPACGWIHYEQLKVGAGVVIEKNGALLLLQRAHEPWRGSWNLPAGYAEVDEAPAQAAERETFEETGLQVKTSELLGAYYFDNDPRGNGVLLVYACVVVEGDLRGSDESQNMRYFTSNEILENIAGGGHMKAVADWKRGKFGMSK